MLQVHREALQATEQDGIVFIDEIDKIVTSSDSHFSERLYLPSRLACKLSAVGSWSKSSPQASAHKEAGFGHQEDEGFADLVSWCHTSAAGRCAGADASSEGVQRDLLPIIEGSVVSTKYGNVNTDHILFICSGAFHAVRFACAWWRLPSGATALHSGAWRG